MRRLENGWLQQPDAMDPLNGVSGCGIVGEAAGLRVESSDLNVHPAASVWMVAWVFPYQSEPTYPHHSSVCLVWLDSLLPWESPTRSCHECWRREAEGRRLAAWNERGQEPMFVAGKIVASVTVADEVMRRGWMQLHWVTGWMIVGAVAVVAVEVGPMIAK